MPSRIRSVAALAILLATASASTMAVAADFTVKAETIPELKAVFGQVESRTVVPARARIGGTIREIAVSEGSEVTEGQVIGRVVDDKLALELDAAAAKIKALESQLANAQAELDRNQQLLARGFVSQSKLDEAKTQYDVVTNQIAAAVADKAVIEQRGREGDIVAPKAGRVLTVPVTLGSVIVAGEEVARIASGQYYLRLSLPERHAAAIKEGDTVAIGERGIMPASDDAAHAAQPGRIAKVYPEISDGRVIADVEVGGIGDYFVNERTLVWIPIGTRSVIAVPPTAISTRHGIDYVRLASAGGSEVAVVLGEMVQTAAGSRVEILTGLRDGDVVDVPEQAQ